MFKGKGEGEIKWVRRERIHFESKNLEDTVRGALQDLSRKVTIA